jgi:diphthamide synthase (EF-2-diphthine--ammonia ligase)
MKAETLKLGLIERVMQVQKKSTLERMDQLITQAEMETRTQESLEAISKGDVLSLDEFSQENREWAKKNYTK